MNEVKNLTRECFQVSNVWCWNEEQTHHIPVETYKNLPEDLGPLFIKAKLTTAGSITCDGYVITCDRYANMSKAIFALGIFFGNREIILNENLRRYAPKKIESLSQILGCPENRIMPIRYETGFSFIGEPPVAGEFRLK